MLNLYAGIGGNRKLWTDCDVTAVELNPEIASIYSELYPQDNVIVDDAHEYLLNHFGEYDFIWASPPCQSHSKARQSFGVKINKNKKPIYIDSKLWEEIIFLKHNTDAIWLVENVVPYYEPLIKPTFQLQRHLYWANFIVKPHTFKKSIIELGSQKQLCDLYGFDMDIFKNKKIENKRQVLRNCVLPEIGEYIFSEVKKLMGFKVNFTNASIEDFL